MVPNQTIPSVISDLSVPIDNKLVALIEFEKQMTGLESAAERGNNTAYVNLILQNTMVAGIYKEKVYDRLEELISKSEIMGNHNAFIEQLEQIHRAYVAIVTHYF
jgi:hypothetical protein